MKTTTTRICISVIAAALALSLSACGKKDSQTAATQVAAKVGSEEISVHQINQVLSHTNTAGAPPETVQALSRTVLDKLIDQQLAVDKATEKNLHRTPEVMAQIEAARRDILARAYLQQITSALPKPNADEVKKYYAEHPALFAERRIFNVQEIMLPAQPGIADKVRAIATPGRTIEDIAADLKAKDLKFSGGTATRAAEQIPLELLDKVHLLKDGQGTVIETPQTVTYLRLVSSQTAPVNEAAATPRIEQFLGNQRAAETVAANIKQLRADTTITYMGDFAKAATPATDAAAPPATAAAPVPAATPATGPSALEKGIAGLK